jgi:hypothetical protein
VPRGSVEPLATPSATPSSAGRSRSVVIGRPRRFRVVIGRRAYHCRAHHPRPSPPHRRARG